MGPEAPPAPRQAFLASAILLAGTGVALTAFPLYRFWTLLWSQVVPPRGLGVLAAAAGAYLVVGALGAAILRLLPAPGPRVQRVARSLVWTAALYNMALMGLQIFYPSVTMAPRHVLAIAALAPLIFAARFWRAPPDDQAMLTAGLARLGAGALALPLLSLPYVGWAAAHDQPRLVGAPEPPAGATVRPDAPRRIVLVTYDALRLQSTTVYDPKLDVTPNLARLAADGTAFMNVRASADMTSIALPAMGAGVRPGIFFRQAGNRRTGAIVRSGFMSSLAAHLAPAGYEAGAFMMGISPKTIGFDGDFAVEATSRPAFSANTFNVREFVPLGPALQWIGARLTRQADYADPRLSNPLFATRHMFAQGLGFLKAHPDRAFVWLHLMVPHDPFFHVPPPGEVKDPAIFRRLLWAGPHHLVNADPRRFAIYRGWYHDYARFGDYELGRFLAELKEAGLYDDALIAVSSDHGEDLVDPAHPTHAYGVITERVARVPLVIRRPSPHGRGRRGAAERGPGLRDERLASAVDLVPSVLSLVYDRLPEGLSGESLWAPPSPDRIVYDWALQARFFPEYHRKIGAAVAAYQGRYRYMETWDKLGQGPTATLADVVADPDGGKDLSDRHPALRQRLRDRLYQDNVLEPVP